LLISLNLFDVKPITESEHCKRCRLDIIYLKADGSMQFENLTAQHRESGSFKESLQPRTCNITKEET